ncbi:MAG: STAS domain-containing protein [Planctomycetes bacterium]|nr:STAS domain-containing protein [Planctomycetota bacterium]
MNASLSLLAPGGAFVVQRLDDGEGSRAVVELGSRLDAEAAEALRQLVVELGDDGCRHLHLDLSMLEDLDWTALALLAGLDPHFRRLGGGASWSGANATLALVLMSIRSVSAPGEEQPC